MSNKKILENKIDINGTTYDVTAVHSNAAAQVDHSLKIKVSGVEVSYDGSEEKTVEVVSQSGGTFTGPLTLDADASSIKTNDKNIPNLAIVNEKIAELTGAPLLSWNGSTLSTITPPNDSSTVSPIKTISGSLADFKAFRDKIKNDSTYTKSYYLYLAATGSETDPILLAFLVKPNAVGTDCDFFGIDARKLYSSTDTNFLTFEAITGKFAEIDAALDILRGISGSSSTDNPGILQIQTRIDKLDEDHTETLNTHGTAIQGINTNITNIVNGPTKVASAANADYATSAGMATNDSSGVPINTNYYRTTANTSDVNSIYFSTEDPANPTSEAEAKRANDAKIGDIWIVYK